MDLLNLSNQSSANEVVKATNVASRKKRKRDESPYLKVRSKAVNIFRNQIDKSVSTKRISVDRALEKTISGDYTRNRFLAEFYENVNILLDSKRFERDCKDKNLIPFNAATHVVFDGASKIELVLKNGLYPNYSTRLTELVEPLLEEELLKVSTVTKSPDSAE